jgi:hypothetical protein
MLRASSTRCTAGTTAGMRKSVVAQPESELQRPCEVQVLPLVDEEVLGLPFKRNSSR